MGLHQAGPADGGGAGGNDNASQAVDAVDASQAQQTAGRGVCGRDQGDDGKLRQRRWSAVALSRDKLSAFTEEAAGGVLTRTFMMLEWVCGDLEDAQAVLPVGHYALL